MIELTPNLSPPRADAINRQIGSVAALSIGWYTAVGSSVATLLVTRSSFVDALARDDATMAKWL